MKLLVMVLDCFMNWLIAGQDQWDLCDGALWGVNFESVKRRRWMKNKKIEEISSVSIDVLSRA